MIGWVFYHLAWVLMWGGIVLVCVVLPILALASSGDNARRSVQSDDPE